MDTAYTCTHALTRAHTHSHIYARTSTRTHAHTHRDAIVSSLGGVALAAQETAEDIHHEEGTIAVEIAGVIPTSEISTIVG